MRSETLTFPAGFAWGTATAAYQIEGAWNEAGKSPSIWDTFSHQNGKIETGETGDVTCDHYHRYADDIELMRTLGLKNYRLSLSWPRVLPAGRGAVNEAGLAFYDRLIDALLGAGIEPFVTLYHWDLPQALQDRGGWTNRETTDAFAEYAEVAVRRLGDRVHNWMTHNEPWVVAFVGHLYGDHAPGLKDLPTALLAAHHLLLSHGKAVPVIRANARGACRVGIVNNLEWVVPFTERDEDVAAARRHDGAFNRWFLDPLVRGSYPADLVEWYGKTAPRVAPGDLAAIAAPIDFLGVNYYTQRTIAHDPGGDFLKVRRVRRRFAQHADFEQWEVAPEGLYSVLRRVDRDYGHPVIYVTENGTPIADTVGPDGRVSDPLRIDYLRRHFAAVWQAIDEGVNVKGYFVWSFMDNFEWAFGTSKRFGLVHVDYATQKRTVKESGEWYSRVARENRIEVW